MLSSALTTLLMPTIASSALASTVTLAFINYSSLSFTAFSSLITCQEIYNFIEQMAKLVAFACC